MKQIMSATPILLVVLLSALISAASASQPTVTVPGIGTFIRGYG